MRRFLLTWGLAMLAGYWIWKQPTGAADAVGGALAAVGGAFESAITFLTALFT